MTRHSWGPLALVCALTMMAATACGASGLSFFADQRVDILAPDDRSDVTLPVTIRWSVEDFDVGSGAGSFAVFLDRAPQPPGKTIAWIFRDDDECKATPGCPDDEFLAKRNIFVTRETSLEIQNVPRDVSQNRREEFSEVTVVLLDERGRRVGEGAWSTQFKVPEDE